MSRIVPEILAFSLSGIASRCFGVKPMTSSHVSPRASFRTAITLRIQHDMVVERLPKPRVLPQEIAFRIEISLIEFATIQIADDGLLRGLTIRFDVGEHIVERGLPDAYGHP
jgi:hypothetical protein